MNPDWIYLDNNATTAPSTGVVGAMALALSQTWANASSSHAMGQEARQALAMARGQVARFLNCKPAEVVFTSGATRPTTSPCVAPWASMAASAWS